MGLYTSKFLTGIYYGFGWTGIAIAQIEREGLHAGHGARILKQLCTKWVFEEIISYSTSFVCKMVYSPWCGIQTYAPVKQYIPYIFPSKSPQPFGQLCQQLIIW